MPQNQLIISIKPNKCKLVVFEFSDLKCNFIELSVST